MDCGDSVTGNSCGNNKGEPLTRRRTGTAKHCYKRNYGNIGCGNHVDTIILTGTHSVKCRARNTHRYCPHTHGKSSLQRHFGGKNGTSASNCGHMCRASGPRGDEVEYLMDYSMDHSNYTNASKYSK